MRFKPVDDSSDSLDKEQTFPFCLDDWEKFKTNKVWHFMKDYFKTCTDNFGTQLYQEFCATKNSESSAEILKRAGLIAGNIQCIHRIYAVVQSINEYFDDKEEVN